MLGWGRANSGRSSMDKSSDQLPPVSFEIDEHETPRANRTKFFSFDMTSMGMDGRLLPEDETIGSMLRKSFWQINITCTFLLFVILIFAIIGMNATDRRIENSEQESLLGQKVRTSLSIISPKSKEASLNFRAGEADVKLLSMALNNDGEFSITQSWDSNKESALVFDVDGKAFLGNSVEIGGSLEVHSIATTSEGISFPDGTKMLSAAKVLAGLASDNDLNLGAAVEDSTGSIILSVDKVERARITSSGSHFRHFDDSDDPLTKGISLYPSTRSIVLNDGKSSELKIWEKGLSVDAGEGIFEAHSNGLYLNSSNSFSISSAKSLEIKSGTDFDALGSPLKLHAGNGISTGGDIVIDGGNGPDKNGDVHLGTNKASSIQIGNADTLLMLKGLSLNVSVSEVSFSSSNKLYFGTPETEIALKGQEMIFGKSDTHLHIFGETLNISSDSVTVGENLITRKSEVHMGNAKSNVTIKGNIKIGDYTIQPNVPSSLIYSAHLTFQNAYLEMSNGTNAYNFNYSTFQKQLKPYGINGWGVPSCILCIDFEGQANSPALISLFIEGATLEMFDETDSMVERREAVLKCSVVNSRRTELVKLSTFFSETLYSSGIGISMSGQKLVTLEETDSLSIQCSASILDVQQSSGRRLSQTTLQPSSTFTEAPTLQPSTIPTKIPTFQPTTIPTRNPTFQPTTIPTDTPTLQPTRTPTETPTVQPSTIPTGTPTLQPTTIPTEIPTVQPSTVPTATPTFQPTTMPTESPTFQPTTIPTGTPTFQPTTMPTESPTFQPTTIPTGTPTFRPTPTPTEAPTLQPTERPSVIKIQLNATSISFSVLIL